MPRAEQWQVSLPAAYRAAHAPPMFCVTEAEAAAIRAIFHERGEFAAAVELRRLLPGITDTAQARECARTTADWKPVQSLQSGHSAIN